MTNRLIPEGCRITSPGFVKIEADTLSIENFCFDLPGGNIRHIQYLAFQWALRRIREAILEWDRGEPMFVKPPEDV